MSKQTPDELLHSFAGCGYPHPHYVYCEWCDNLPEAKQALATELVRMMTEALPNKKSWEEDVGFDYSLKEMNAHNQAIDQTRTRLTAIIERELG